MEIGQFDIKCYSGRKYQSSQKIFVNINMSNKVCLQKICSAKNFTLFL